MKMANVTINGHQISVPATSTIMEAANKAGVYIPRLCWDRRLKPYGGCRLCLVEWEGNAKLFAACSTPVREGMVIQTESERIARARKVVLELLLVHHPLDCPVCDKAGECELQDLAFKYGPSQSRFKGKRKHDEEILDAPLLERNPNRCILCGKCVRICTEHQGVGAISLIGRGYDTIVSPAFEETLDCEFCGQCIDVCPVGSLGSKPYRFRSRVWYMEDRNTTCPYCGCGCTVTLSIGEGRIMRATGADGVGLNKGDLCGKGRFGFDFVSSEKRVKTPLIRKGGELVETTWEEASSFVAGRLAEIISANGPEAVGAVGSQILPLEDNYMLQKFMREALGSNNIDSMARFGYARSQSAIKKAFGLNALPISYDSPLSADHILVVESDLTSTHPVWGLKIFAAARDFGAKLTVIDPKLTKLSRHSTEWLRNKPGSSVALLNGMMRVILDEGLHDPRAETLPGFAELKASLDGCQREKAAEMAGVGVERMAVAAREFAAAKNRMLCMSLGAAENTKGEDTVLAATNLLMLLGSGPDALQLPAEYSNTLGMFEAGVRPDAGPSHSAVSKPGLTLGDMFYQEKSPLKAMIVMGENLAVSMPGAGAVERTLKSLDLLVVMDIMLSDTAKLAHVVLPAASWSEKEGTMVCAAGIEQPAVKCVDKTGESVPDWQILRNLARFMQKEIGAGGVGGLESLRVEIKKNVTLRFDRSAAAPKFNPVEFKPGEQTDGTYPLTMVTGNLMQHSGSLTTLSKNIESVVSDAYVQVNNRDARNLGIKDDSYVKLSSRRGEVLLKARVTDEVPEGMVFAPAHFSHARLHKLTFASSNGASSTVAVRIENS